NWTSTGSKIITLTVQSGNCPSAPDTQKVQVYAIPTSTFAFDHDSACLTKSSIINYTGSASAGANYNWNFGGGNATPGTGQGPQTITWPSPGNYTATLTVTENGCTSTQSSKTVVVSGVYTSTFTTSSSTLCGTANPVTINYTGTAPANANYSWVVSGGGTAIPGTGQGPQ